MTEESARYTETGHIRAVLGGVTMTIPDTMANRHRREIAEKGISIAPCPIPTVTGDDVNIERQKRIEAGCSVSVTGVVDPIPVQGRPQDQTNLLGLATSAQLRIASGDTTTTITFRDADNVNHLLTPVQVIELWQGGASYISSVMQASWDLKGMDPIPSDYTDDAYWPVP